MKAHNLGKEELVKILKEKNIKIINLCHIPEDGRLKTLAFTGKNLGKLEEILEFGERVDGSSLFSYIGPNMSDVYIVPKLESAFADPFSTIPALNIMCQYLGENGKPLDIAPENVLLRAEEKLRDSTGVVLKALAELEFYVIYKQEEMFFPDISDRNYQESMPFAKSVNFRNEILITLENIGVATKYGHAEVGKFYSRNGYVMEQHEIEFLPQYLKRMAEVIALAKWVIRNVCAKYGVVASFTPKLSLEHAGNGMHFHFCGLRENKNIIADPEAKLTDEAKRIIGGILKFAPSLTAFGNTIPVSYLRFISRKESPMYICWGTRNRLALIRIPLWWNFKKDITVTDNCRRTFEFRAPDPSANSYLLLAGIAVATRHGLENSKESIEIANDLNADGDKRDKGYDVLPLSCSEAANDLQRDRAYYEAKDVFPGEVIDGTICKLKSYNDEELWKNLRDEPVEIENLLLKYVHYG